MVSAQVTASAELSSDTMRTSTRTPMSEPSYSPSACAATGPQQTALARALKGAADLHNRVSTLSWNTLDSYALHAHTG